jgi:hypothetical protein
MHEMMMFLGMLATGMFLFALITLLHKLQYKQKVDAVDRTIPLPPLNPQDRQRVLAIAGDAAAEFHAAIARGDKPEKWLDRMLAKAPESARNWQASARELAAAHDYPRALACCALAFPQIGALRQAAQILRQQIREAQNQGASVETALADLYRIAAWADLLHHRLAEFVPLASTQLRKLDLRVWQDFAFDYSTLGCNKLDLLTSVDRKRIIATWGNPKQHVHARELYDKDLLSMFDQASSSQGAT